jgi:hypothetical protein
MTRPADSPIQVGWIRNFTVFERSEAVTVKIFSNLDLEHIRQAAHANAAVHTFSAPVIGGLSHHDAKSNNRRGLIKGGF